MTTHFDLLRQVCGLSQREAAELLGVRLDTVKNWSIGRRNPSDAVLKELATLAMRIETEASLAKWKEFAEVALSDEQAKAFGWPCVGAQHSFAGRVIARKLTS